nr:MAG TPA: hypothetical protein [Caudoviricetes sp.]
MPRKSPDIRNFARLLFLTRIKSPAQPETR